METCWPWFHGPFGDLANQTWTKTIISSGCSADHTGSVPCDPEKMRASAEAWLRSKAPEALKLIDGSLSFDAYMFARYMHSEVGSGTIEERVAVGEAALNQARRRAGPLGSWRSKLRGMLIPNGKFGAIHCPDAYCASIGMSAGCNCAKRWAATSRDPSIMTLLLAHLVISGQSDNFARGAETQWGPEYLKNSDGSRMQSGTTRARVESFVRYAASSSGGNYYWVGPLVGIDPWHTWLARKGPSGDEAAIQRGIAALPLSGGTSGKPMRPSWNPNMPLCGRSGTTATFATIGIVGLIAGAWAFTADLFRGIAKSR